MGWPGTSLAIAEWICDTPGQVSDLSDVICVPGSLRGTNSLPSIVNDQTCGKIAHTWKRPDLPHATSRISLPVHDEPTITETRERSLTCSETS